MTCADKLVVSARIHAVIAGICVFWACNAYMNLSPTMRMFGTAINYGFGDVEETGILIAVDEIMEEKRMRHVESFLKNEPNAVRFTSGQNKVIYPDK